MQTSMSFANIAAMYATMAVLSFVPSVSALAVVTRSASSGFIHGVFTTTGIVLGDIIFILIAIFGLSVLTESMGSLFVLVKYLGGAYLIWLGISLWRSKSKTLASGETGEIIESSLLSSFMTGLIITLGDQKAILFYLVFFPAFVDLSKISYIDTTIIIIIAIVTVGTAKLCYAYMACSTSLFLNNANAIKRLNISAGVVIIGIGIYLIITP